MEKITCEVIRDLLPLYCDGVCSENSRALVKGHIERCSDCQKIYMKMKAGSEGDDNEAIKDDEESIIKSMASSWKKSLKKSFLKGTLLTLLVFIVIGTLYWSGTRLAVSLVPVSAVTSEIVSESEDRIHIHVEVVDLKKVLESRNVLTEDGKLYITFYRGIIPVNNGFGENSSMDFIMALSGKTKAGETVEITQIYYGTENNYKLLWERE